MSKRADFRINVGHGRVRVREVKDLEPNEDGDWSHAHMTVKLDRALSRRERLNSLLHELGHMVYSMDHLHDGSTEEKETEERVVTCLANRLSEALLRNPRLRRYVSSLWR
jgi:hypothetical protein